MKILVFGNIGSGKTTLLNKLKEVVPWSVISIDDYRRKYGDGTENFEVIAKKHFFEDIKPNKNQFIECLGTGQFSEELFTFFSKSNEELLCIKLITPKEICRLRLKNRIWDIPFPKPLEQVDTLIDRTEDRILRGDIENLWSKRKNTTIISKECLQFEDIDKIIEKIKILLAVHNLEESHNLNDVEKMLDNNVQEYYSNEYIFYQTRVIKSNGKLVDDQMMISKFITELHISGNIIDIGCGNCQWFSFFENKIDCYYAIDANSKALSLAPNSKKIIRICQNIFDTHFEISKVIHSKIDTALCSFFLSHFTDSTISELFKKLADIDSLLIVDSLWNKTHKLKFPTKQLKNVNRYISEKDYIEVPKRYFEFSDLKNIGITRGYTITDFLEGNYWFVCKMERK